MLGYNNDTNPFGDSNLLQPFTWSKKVEKQKSSTESTSDERIELLKDIERVRRRRDEKEKEQQEKDRLRAEEQRLRDMAQYGDWEKKEEEFHIKQTSVRSKIRLVENRSQPIDLLARNILLIETLTIMTSDKRDIASGVSGDVDLNNNLVAQLDIDLTDPISILDDLDVADLDKLLDDINSYVQLETCKSKGATDTTASVNRVDYKLFWENMKIVALHEKDVRLNSRESMAVTNNKIINKSIKDDVTAMIQGKSLLELENLSLEIQQSVKEGRVTDVSYWEIIQKEIVLQKAKIGIEEVHGYLLKQQHDYLALHAVKKEEMSSTNQLYTTGDDSEYRPENTEDLNLNVGLSVDGDSEEVMKSWDEVITNRVYNWADKYRPRKPRYFNSIRSGWDWNKYNQTHYDKDTPPPKVVQGYKFCIFYPDLIDKTKTPKYTLEGCDDPLYAIIRFQAGPPYEDIAFKIVNKEWDTGRKYSGFKSVFDRGVLQVHFNFKRLFYRR